MQTPALQTLPMVQLVQVAPPLPQAADEEPVSQAPVAEQQPLAQVAAVHFGTGGAQEKTDNERMTPTIASFWWFMGSPEGVHHTAASRRGEPAARAAPINWRAGRFAVASGPHGEERNAHSHRRR